MKWLIQPIKTEEEQINQLLKMLDMAGQSYDLVWPQKGIVVSEDKQKYNFDNNEQYFVLGSYTLTRLIHTECKDAVFSLENYNFEDLLNTFGKYNFLNSDAKVLKIKDIDLSNDMFLRPLNDDKLFNGGVYNKDNFPYDKVNEETEVVAANLKKVLKEHRFFVIDEKIVGGSLYKLNGVLTTSSVIDEESQSFAEEMIKKFKEPGFVIDIAQTDNGCKIVELNCLNASGFYELNLYKLINSVMDYYEKLELSKSIHKSPKPKH